MQNFCGSDDLYDTCSSKPGLGSTRGKTRVLFSGSLCRFFQLGFSLYINTSAGELHTNFVRPMNVFNKVAVW